VPCLGKGFRTNIATERKFAPTRLQNHRKMLEETQSFVLAARIFLCRILGFHGGGYEEYHLLGYDAE
jgi:hypothetical protein